MNDARAILLWSAGLSLLALVVAGVYFTNQIYSGISFEDDAVSSSIRSSLDELSQSGGGSARFFGARFDGGYTVDSRTFETRYSDYRADELDSGFFVPAGGVTFACSGSVLSCHDDFVSTFDESIDSDLRLDGVVTCQAKGRQLHCVVELMPSSSGHFSKTNASVFDTPVRRDSMQWLASVLPVLRAASTPRNPVLDIYDGRATMAPLLIIATVSQLGVLRFAESAAMEERLDAAANREYGFPFVDGTTDLERRVRNLRSKVHSPRTLPDPTPPPLAYVLKASDENAYGDGVVALGSNPSRFVPYFVPYYLGDEFARSLAALLYFPVTVPTHLLAVWMDAFGSGGEPAAAAIYPHVSEGTFEEQAQRLRAVYEMENDGLSTSEKEQRLANALSWLSKHPDLDSVTLRESLRADETIRADSVSGKAGGVPLRFKAPEVDLNVFNPTFAYDVDESRVHVEAPRHFYWIVRKDAINNGYVVFLSTTSTLEDDAS